MYVEERKLVAETMVRLYDRQLTTVSGGNISLRINEDCFAITPSALDKGKLTAEQIAIVKFDGTNLTPELKLSIESEMHRKILIARPDMNAVVHAHPIFASSFASSLAVTVNTKLTAEAYAVMGEVVNVPYQLMGTRELADAVSEQSKKTLVMLMENHGAIAVGKSMLNAFDKLELLERTARMQIVCQWIPGSHALNAAQCDAIDVMVKRK